jgi:uncharacterized paraquat-inducible protein A
MYCSSCGGVVTKGLTYCKHCGAKLNGAKGDGLTKSTELFPDSLVWAIVSIFVLGIGSSIALMAIMKKLGFNEGMISGIVVMTFLLTLIVEATFIWLLISRGRGNKEARETERLREQTTRELDAAQARLLPEPVPSVTEHTTRTLEHSLSDRKLS